MIFILRSFITYSIILTSLFTVLHVDEHDHEKHEGYSFCDIECSEKDHQYNNHQCEICINNNSNIILTSSSSKVSYKYYSSILSKFEFQKTTFLSSNLLSRPPPVLL